MIDLPIALLAMYAILMEFGITYNYHKVESIIINTYTSQC